jgi:hypothetical protein
MSFILILPNLLSPSLTRVIIHAQHNKSSPHYARAANVVSAFTRRFLAKDILYTLRAAMRREIFHIMYFLGEALRAGLKLYIR